LVSRPLAANGGAKLQATKHTGVRFQNGEAPQREFAEEKEDSKNERKGSQIGCFSLPTPCYSNIKRFQVVGGQLFTKTKTTPTTKETNTPVHKSSTPFEKNSPVSNRMDSTRHTEMVIEDMDDGGHKPPVVPYEPGIHAQPDSHSTPISPNAFNPTPAFLQPKSLFERNFEAESKNAEFFLEYSKKQTQ